MNWDAFWSGLIGTALPSLFVAALMLVLTNRVNRALERHKKELEQNLVKFSKLHDKRLEAMIVVYHAFCDYLDFLRKSLYVPQKGIDISPMQKFDDTIRRQLVYLDKATADKVLAYQADLLGFWNWAFGLRLPHNLSLTNLTDYARPDWKELRRRLDEDVPWYLSALRQDIAAVIDPHHEPDKTTPPLSHNPGL